MDGVARVLHFTIELVILWAMRILELKILLTTLLVAFFVMATFSPCNLWADQTIADLQELEAQIDKLLAEGHAAFQAGDFQKAKKIAITARKKRPTGSKLEDANKLYFDSHQAFKNLKYVMSSPTPFISFEQVRLPDFGPGLYKKFSVDLASGVPGSVAGIEYSAAQMQKYYELSGSTEASRLAGEGLALKKSGKNFLFWSIGAGAVLGLGGGIVYAAINHIQDKMGFGPALMAVEGTVAGLGLGAVTGLTGMIVYSARSKPRFEKAANSFNEYLEHELRIGVAPVSGGVVGNLSLAF